MCSAMFTLYVSINRLSTVYNMRKLTDALPIKIHYTITGKIFFGKNKKFYWFLLFFSQYCCDTFCCKLGKVFWRIRPSIGSDLFDSVGNQQKLGQLYSLVLFCHQSFASFHLLRSGGATLERRTLERGYVLWAEYWC